jgi:hypothetical protein
VRIEADIQEYKERQLRGSVEGLKVSRVLARRDELPLDDGVELDDSWERKLVQASFGISFMLAGAVSN